jgi:hypothetical protein
LLAPGLEAISLLAPVVDAGGGAVLERQALDGRDRGLERGDLFIEEVDLVALRALELGPESLGLRIASLLLRRGWGKGTPELVELPWMLASWARLSPSS